MYRRLIETKVNETVEVFMRREDICCVFGKPYIAYTDAKDPLFLKFHKEGLSVAPKKIYRAANTVITHYVPVTEKPQNMLRMHFESIWLAMAVNREIKAVMRECGRLISNTGALVEWDSEKHGYEWDDRIAAYIGGIGDIGPAGSLKVDGSFGGRASSLLLDSKLCRANEYEDTDEEIRKYLEKAGYSASSALDDVKENCPAKAMGDKGIDRKACENYCSGINPATPCPEVCGRCFGI